ncbi:MAG: LuxR C-terminal-related transcriptional regulator [Candidatus Velamenicoccus archaeovorus]
MRTRVGVAEEDEIYRRGLLEALRQDASLQVAMVPERPDARGADFDVIVASETGLEGLERPGPVILLSRSDANRKPTGLDVAGVLPRTGLTEEQLRLAVHAAAIGLRVQAETEPDDAQPVDARRLQVLHELAGGADTKAIADRLKYSERTVKTLIHDLQQRFGTQTRAQTVAEAIRRGLI